MAAILAKYVSKKLLKETAKNQFGKDDPNFKIIRLDLSSLSEHDVRLLKKVKRRAHILDKGLFTMCGISVGISSVFALFPFVGDLFDAFMAWMVIQTCKKIDGGLPSNIVNKMIMNLVLDFAIGLMPFLGDLADTIFQCNVRNANLLEAYLSEQGEARLRAQPAAASSRGTNPRPVEPAITNAQVHPQQPMTDPVGPPPGYERDAPSQNKVRRPSTTTKQTSGSRAAWFRFGKGASRVQDPEQGVAH